MKIQQKLKAPKSQHNKFGNYNYRNCEDILEAVKPLLSEHGLTLVLSDTIAQVGTRYYVVATATLYKDKEVVGQSTAYAREAESKKGMDESQITGAASSYARKYALNGLFCIDDTKDADTPTNNEEEPKPLNLDDVKDGVMACNTIEELTALWETWASVINKASNKKDALAYFSARKHFLQGENNASI
jgi:hypothetical protein